MKKILGLLFLSILTLEGCLREKADDDGSNRLHRVAFSAVCDPLPNELKDGWEKGHRDGITTKSTLDYGLENQINRLRLVAYNISNGMKMSDTGELTGDEINSIYLELYSRESIKVYFAANMHGLDFPDRDDLKDMYWMLPSFGSMNEEGIPMSGSLIVTPEDIKRGSVICYLKRLVAMVNLTLDLSNVSEEKLSILGARIHNMNRRLVPFDDGTSNAALSYTDIERGSELGEADDTDECYFDYGDLSSSGKLSATMCVPANCQGDLLSGNADPDEKVPENIGEQADLCSYVQIYGECSGYGDMEGPVSYRFFLGENGTSNFDILPNSVYNVTFTPTEDGVSRQDWWKVDTSQLEEILAKSIKLSTPSIGMDVQDEACFSVKYKEGDKVVNGSYGEEGRNGWHFECRYADGTEANDVLFTDSGVTYWGEDEFIVHASLQENMTIEVTAVTNDGKSSDSMLLTFSPRIGERTYDEYYIDMSLNSRNIGVNDFETLISNRPFPIKDVAKTRVITTAIGAHSDEIENWTCTEDESHPKFPKISDADRLCHFNQYGDLYMDLSKKKWHETQDLTIEIYFWRGENGGYWEKFSEYSTRLILCDGIYTTYSKPIIYSWLIDSDEAAPLMEKLRENTFYFNDHISAANPWYYTSSDTYKEITRTNGNDNLGAMFYSVYDYSNESEMLPYVLDFNYYWLSDDGNTIEYGYNEPDNINYALMTSYGMGSYHLPY